MSEEVSYGPLEITCTHADCGVSRLVSDVQFGDYVPTETGGRHDTHVFYMECGHVLTWRKDQGITVS